MKRTATATAAVLLAAALATLTACSSDDDSTNAKPAADKSSQAPSVSDADKAKAREAAGLPPEPDAATAAAFVQALNGINADIVHGKDEKAVSRGSDTCGIIKNFPRDRTKQIDQTNKRWSSPTHPDGHGLATAEKILDTAHKHLCPDF